MQSVFCVSKKNRKNSKNRTIVLFYIDENK